MALQSRGGRTARGADDEQGAFIEHDEGGGTTHVGKLRGAGCERDVGIGAELRRTARGAVLRRLELAREIVMLERRRDDEDGVDRQPDKRQAPRETTALSRCHLHRLYSQRPTTSLNRPAIPPRSFSPACWEMPPAPRIPVTWVYWTSTPSPTHRCRRNSAPALARNPVCLVSMSSPGSENDELS